MTTKKQAARHPNPIFPDISVKLTNHDANIFSVMSTVRKALKEHKVSDHNLSKFSSELLKSSCYSSALNVCFRWVHVI